MKLLASGLDTIECAYYLYAGPGCKLDFSALRLQREIMREYKQPKAAVLELGGMEFLLSPNGTKSCYPFVISNQNCAIRFGEFSSLSFLVRCSSLALSCKWAKFLHDQFRAWADALGLQDIKAGCYARQKSCFARCGGTKEMGTPCVPNSASNCSLTRARTRSVNRRF